jgi:hypothetical protein
VGWKLYFGLMLVLTLWGDQSALARRETMTPLEWIDLVVVGPLTLFGVCGYAFKIRSFSPRFWRAYAFVYVAWQIVTVGMMFVDGTGKAGAEMVAMTLALIVALLIAVPAATALFRYSRLWSQPSEALHR